MWQVLQRKCERRSVRRERADAHSAGASRSGIANTTGVVRAGRSGTADAARLPALAKVERTRRDRNEKG